MVIDQIIAGLVTAAFAGGGAWAGTQIRIKSIESRLAKIENGQKVIGNRLIRLITSHNRNHDDDIPTNDIGI